MVKDRSTAEDPKKEKISIRITAHQKSVLERKAGRANSSMSRLLFERLRPLLTMDEGRRETSYECCGCGNSIGSGEKYYCELANLERFVESDNDPLELEIDVLDSLPTRILCGDCAEKAGKLGQFAESEPKETSVKGSERKLE